MESSSSVEVPDLYENNGKQSTFKNQTKLPTNALALYIKLYCSKKCSKSSKYTSNVIEATKSWTSLCDKEKEQFYNKYKACQQKHRQIIGNCLQKAEPYMKKRINKYSQKKDFHDINIDGDLKDMITDENQVKLETHEEQDLIDPTEYMSKIDDNNIFYNEIDQTTIQSHTEHTVNSQVHPAQEPSHIHYLKPTPPSIKSGKELFEIMKQIDKQNDSTWTSLTNKEKCHHNRAVLMLKQDYILKYKQYLEHLPQRELFDYYNKTFR